MTERNIRSMLQRLADKGFPVDFNSLDAPFNLIITSVASIDVDASTIIKFSQRLKDIVHETAFRCELAGIAVFPMILNPEVKSTGNTMTWKRKDRAYLIRRNIDFYLWQNSKPAEKKTLLAECVIDSISNIPIKHLSQSSKEALVAIVLQAIRLSGKPRNLRSDIATS